MNQALKSAQEIRQFANPIDQSQLEQSRANVSSTQNRPEDIRIDTAQDYRQIVPDAREAPTPRSVEQQEHNQWERALRLNRQRFPDHRKAEQVTEDQFASAFLSQELGRDPGWVHDNLEQATMAYLDTNEIPRGPFQAIREQFEVGFKQLELAGVGRRAMREAQDGEISQETWAEIERLQGEMQTTDDADDQNFFVRSLMAAAEQGPRILRSGGVHIVSTMLGRGIGGLLGSAIGPAGTAAGSKIGAWGGRAASVALLGDAYASSTFIEAIQMETEDGDRISPDLAVVPSRIAGSLAAATELFAVSQIPGVREASQAIAGNTIGRIMANKALPQITLNAVKRYGTGIAAGVANEIAQESAQMIGVEMARSASELESELPQATLDDIVERMSQVVEQTAMSYGVLGLPGTAINIATGVKSDTKNIREYRQEEQVRKRQEVEAQQLADDRSAGVEQVRSEYEEALRQANESGTDQDVQSFLQVRERLSRLENEEMLAQASAHYDYLQSGSRELAPWQMSSAEYQERTGSQVTEAPRRTQANLEAREQFRFQMQEAIPQLSGEQSQAAMSFIDVLADHHGITTDQFIDTRFEDPGFISVESQGQFAGRRAGIQFSPDEAGNSIRAVIQATENADITSVIHELAHLEERFMPQADYETVREWALSLTDDSDFQRMQAGEISEQRFVSEKLAEGFEGYIRDGRVQNESIRPIMERLTEFAKEVYQRVMRRLPQVPQQVAEVFERMLAPAETAADPQQVIQSQASDSLQNAVITGEISQEQAFSIVQESGRNDFTQAAGLARAEDMDAQTLANYTGLIAQVADERQLTEESLRENRSALAEYEQIAREATSVQRQLSQQAQEIREALATEDPQQLQAAADNALIETGDVQALQTRLSEIEARMSQWENWQENRSIRDWLREQLGLPVADMTMEQQVELLDQQEVDEDLLFQSDPTHEESVREAVEMGYFVPDHVLQEYSDQAWAAEELQRHQDLYQEAKASGDLSDFVEGMTALAFEDDNRGAQYYTEVFYEAQLQEEQFIAEQNERYKRGQKLIDRGQENRAWLESLEKPVVEAILRELAETNQLDGFHNVIQATAKSIRGGKRLSDAAYKRIMDQIRDNPTQYRYEFALAAGDQEMIAQMEQEAFENPLEQEIDELRDRNRRLRQDNSNLGKNYRQLNREAKNISNKWNALYRRYQQKDSELRSQITEVNEAYKEQRRLQRRLESEGRRADREKARADNHWQRRKELISERAELKRQLKRSGREAVQEYRQQLEAKRYAEKTIKQIMRKPAQNIDYEYAKQIRERQSQLRIRTPREVSRARRDLPRLLNDTSISDEVKQAIQQALAEQSLKEMTAEQLEQIKSEIDQLRKEGREVRTQKIAEEKATRDRAKKDLIQRVNPDYKVPEGLGLQAVEQSRKSPAWVDAFLQSHTIGRIAQWLDQGQSEGPFQTWLLKEVENAIEGRLRSTEQRLQQAQTQAKELGLDPRQFTKTRQANGQTFQVQELMGLYLYSQNDRASERLHAHFQQSTIDAAIAQLTDAERQYADWMIDHFDEHYDRLSQAFIDDQNQALGRESRYFPMMVRDITTEQMPEQIANDILSTTGITRSYVNRGFTKGRIKVSEEHQPAMRLDAFAIFSTMVPMQENYIHTASTIKRLQNIFNDRAVNHAIVGKYGTSVKPRIQDYLNTIVNPTGKLKRFDKLETLSQQLRTNMGVAALAFNAVTFTKQLPSINLVLGRSNATNLALNAAQFAFNAGEMHQFVTERDPYIAAMKYDPIIEEMRMNNKTAYQRAVNKVGHAGMYFIGVMDKTVKTIAWKAIYDTEKQNGSSEQDAIHKARRGIIDTQPGGFMHDLPATLTSGEGFRWFTLFSSQLSKIFGIATYDIPNAVKQGEIANAARMSAGFIISALAIGMIDNSYSAPEDPEELRDMGVRTGLSSVPILGPSMASAYDGWQSSEPQPLETARSLVTSARLAFDDEADRDRRFNASRRALEDILFTAGVPMVQGRRMMEWAQTGDFSQIIGGIGDDE